MQQTIGRRNFGGFHSEITDTIIHVTREDNDKQYFGSRFEFLNAHKGFRPGSIHLFIAPSGNGKSTMAKSIMLDLIAMKTPTFFWLSEEKKYHYFIPLQQASLIAKLDIDWDIIKIFSEQDGEKNSTIIESIKKTIVENKIKIMFFDNVTTSEWYGEDYKTQSQSIKSLKRLVNETGVSLIIFAHTDSKIAASNFSSMIDQSSVRGAKTISNISDYIYILQQFTSKSDKYQTLRIEKSRSHQVDCKFYKLIYSKKTSCYSKDVTINFDDFKKIFDSRDNLNSRKK